MNIKKNLIILYTLINIILIFFVSFSNTKKVNINIFTWKSNNHSLGKIISFSFMTGISFNTLLSLIILSYESNNNSSKENDFQDRNEREDDLLFEDNPERPPERDIKETQPTISVNYRVIDSQNYTSQKYNNKSKFRGSERSNDEDWGEKDYEW